MKFVKDNRSFLTLIADGVLAFFLFWLNPFGLSPEANKAVAIAVLMILWWVTEAMPMPVVALVPLVLHPLLGISKIETVASAYSDKVIFLFMGGFMIGLAIEKWNLHKRIALGIVRLTGTGGNGIILGFILATGLLSSFLSNTATTMMMFPIALSVISVMKEHESPGSNIRNFSLVLMLVIAYASNIGGMATIIGTPPNVAYVNIVENKYNYTVGFSNWLLLCAPIAILLLGSLYFILAKILFPNGIKRSPEATAFIQTEIKKLGPLSKPEIRVLIVFLFTALLWICKDLVNKILPYKLDDNMIAIFGAILLFAIPSGKKGEGHKQNFLLEWADTSKMAWGILLLFGGGLALASSLERVGVMKQIGEWLAGFSSAHGFVLVLMVTVVSIFLSEIMSNVAQVIVLAPVLNALSDALHMNPLILGIPMTLAASAASMMPMGTPPNAIVFSSGHIKLKEMMKAGLVMNLVSILLITLFCWFLLPLIMKAVGH